MSKLRCFQPINFDGAEFDSFRYHGSFLILKIILWDGEECELEFKNPCFFSTEMSFFGFRPYEVTDIVLLKDYIDVEEKQLEKYKIFCFEDLNEIPAVIVVAESGERQNYCWIMEKAKLGIRDIMDLTCMWKLE